MKTKFHLTKRTNSRFSSASAAAGGPASQAMALVDERFLGWLATQHSTQNPLALQRTALAPVMAHLLRAAGFELPLQRTYLFSDTAPTQLLDDMVLRTVPQHSADGGLGLVRAMGLELTQLAQRGACGVVLLVSDDERLIPYIDEAQWRGLKVVLVSDENSLDVPKLMGEDPSWARLLLQADRRVAINDVAWTALTVPGAALPVVRQTPSSSYTLRDRDRDHEPQHNHHHHQRDEESAFDGASPRYASAPANPDEVPGDEWRAQVQRAIHDWWADETPHARLDLYEEMQRSQGVPPETDRHLLLRVRRELLRTLTFQEKKVMREMIRAVVLAQPPLLDDAPPRHPAPELATHAADTGPAHGTDPAAEAALSLPAAA